MNRGTQTDGVYEITSMKKEGLKFLVSRIYNLESKSDGCTRNYKMCSIADPHFFNEPGEEDRSPFNFDPTGNDCTDDDCTKWSVCKGVFIKECYDFSDPEDEDDELEDTGHELDFLSFKAGIHGTLVSNIVQHQNRCLISNLLFLCSPWMLHSRH